MRTEKFNLCKSTKKLLTLITLLSLGVGQMWADPWVCRSTDGGKKATKTVGDKLNNGSEWNYTFTTNGGWDDGWVKVYVGIDASNKKEVSAEWVSNDGSNKNVKADIGDVKFDKSGNWYAVGAYNVSSKTAYTTSNSTWTNNSTLSFGSNSEPYWQVNPPAVKSSSVSVAATNTAAGSGTGLSSGSPIILISGMSSTLTITATQNVSDANSALWCKFASGSYSSTTTYAIASGTTQTNQTLALAVKYRNNGASLDGTETTTTIYYKWAAPAPAITMTSVTPSSSIVAGNDITLVGTRANSSNTISFQYTTNDGGTWTDITPKTSSLVSNALTITWTIPDAHGANQTFKFRAKLAEATPIYSSKSSGVTVYNTKTIRVKNTNNWGTLYVYAWDGSGDITNSWAGNTGNTNTGGFTCTNIGGGLWWDVVITSRATNFIINCNSSGEANQTADLSYGTYTHNNCYAIGTNSGKRTLSGTTVSCLTDASVSTTAAASILRTSATLGGNVSGNGNDKIISYGYYYTTNSALSSSNVIGTRIEVGTDNKSGSFTKSQTGLTANTTYYVMAYAKNGNGEAYGSVRSFTTLAQYTVTTGVVTGQTARGSVSPGSVTCSSAEWSSNVTASANEGYSFNSWTTGDGVTKSAATSPTKVKATQNSTIKASFNEVMRTVGVDVNNEYLGSVSAASLTSVGPETASAEVTATPETGATFSSWTLPAGVTAASTYTSSSNPIKVNATLASKTITANFTETKYTVTLSTADASKGTVGSNQSVGQITAVQITATPKSGYMFSKWIKTAGSGTVTYYTGPGNGQLTDASGEEKETTYICVTGAVTLQATWEPDRSSGYVVFYGNDGKNADGGSDPSQTRDWKDGKLYRPTTDPSNTSSFTFTAGVADVNKVIEFKIHKKTSPEAWYGYGSGDGGKIDGSISNVALNTSYGNGRLCIIMPGSYTFTWNSSNNQLSIAYPTDVYYLRGGFNSWAWSHPMTETSSGVYSATVNMTEANHTYSGDNGFKVLIAGQYYGKNSTTVTRSTSTGSAAIGSCSTSGGNIGITTDYTGNYTFTYTVASNTLQVTYPTAYKVTYGKGTVDGSASNCSAIDITNGGTAVTSNSTWVKSGDQVVLTAPAAKSGYRYLGWFANNAGSGAAITTNANCTITVSSAMTRYACYAENMSTITVSAGTGGTVSKGSGSHSLGVTTTVAIDATPSTGYSWSTWTTSGNARLASSAATKSNTAKADGTNGGSGTITATFTPNHYDVILDVNGGSGADQTVDATFAAAMPTVQKGGSTPIATRTRTGYNFDGYWANDNGTGTQYYTSALASNHNWDVATNETHIYAKWNAKQSAITFDYQTSAAGYYSSGSITDDDEQVGTYDQAMTALTGTMPSAKNGYAFMGFYDAVSGGGTKYYNADGSSAHTWDKNTESGTTLYAYYKKAEITALTPDAAVVEPEATIGITPTISPTPVGPIIICWEVRYADTDNPLVPQPADMAYSEGKLTFTAPAVSALYKIHASLKTGSACGAGTELSTNSVNVQVAGSHTVTVDYKYSSTTIAASTAETGRPLVWSDPITAPDIFGYKFDHWTAGTGVSLSEDGENPLGEDESDEATIYIKANYNGTLTANYTLKNIVYFKDNLEWTDPDDADAHIYVNLLQSDYWNNDRGSGNYDRPNRNLEMDRVPGTTDIFYYEYDDKTTSNYISFTRESMGNSGDFYQEAPNVAHVVFPSRAMDALGTNNSSGLGFYAATPMFVPLATQTPVLKNSNRAAYYNDGYWTKYLPGTGYTLQIYNEDGSGPVKQIAFTSADELMPMKAVVDLEGGHTYKFQLKRDGDVYYGNNGTMTYEDHGQNTAWDFYNNYPFNMCTIVTNAAGDYTFNLSYSPNNGGTQNRLRMSVDYPVASGDYRLVYTDNTRSYVEDEVTKYRIKPSAIVNKVNDGTDIVSFFVRHNQTPKLYIQQATVDNEGNITWNEYPTSGTPTNQITGAIASTITSGGTGVYNFNLSMNGSGALSVTSAEAYDGEFYIRTDAANSKWDNYRTDPDHRLTSSDYLKSSVGYTHYYCHWVNKDDVGRKNVKFVIANDYSPCISDTLARETATGTWANIGTWMEEGGDLKRSANVRFMWDQETNAIARAYVDGAQGVGSNNFLKMLSADSKIKNQAETETLTEVYFTDNQNWIYEANIKAQTGAAVQLISNWGDNASKITQYFKGTAESPADLIGGSGDTWYAIRLLYDFKTNRLVAAYIPTGTITEETEINADVMFIREHQGDIEQLTFSGDGTITKIETAYGVMKFNKWTLNNKDKSTHNPLDPELSIFERSLYWISFPFRVKLSEVFGFGTYMSHWAIQRYDGARRAAVGHFLENGTFWRWMDRATEYLEPNQGYLLAIDLDLLGESSSVWGPNSLSEQIELYFPSYGDMPDLTKDNVVQTLEPYECTINRAATEGLPDTGNPATSYNRTIFDSHWRVMSVPTYVNTGNVTFANTTWKTKFGGPNFLYTWNRADNTITATSAESFTYHAMHSYMVQYCGTLTWSASSGSPYTPIVARKTYEEAPRKLELRLEIQQNEQMIDRTYVVMSNEEEVSANFAFGEDMVKEFNARKAAIFNYTADNVGVAGNTMPMSEQTTVIPVGLEIPTAGEYTFAIPDGTEGVGVILVDNVANTRTNLSALDYTVNLTTGTHDGRFVLEISPIHNATTGIEAVSDEGLEITGARKMIIDQKLYIVKDGKLFDATGKRVE